MYEIIIAIIVLLLIAGLRVVKQYERGVIFRLGKFVGEKQPGLRYVWPIFDTLRTVDMRVITMPIQPQKIITRDNVSIDVSAVAYYQVVDSARSVIVVENVMSAINQISQTTVRNIVGKFALDEVLSEVQQINEEIRGMIDVHTAPWGVKVSTVEIKDIQLPDSMQRAMAKQAEAEREKRAKIIAAEGEALAAQKLAETADIMMAHPIALQLRNLQTLAEISVEKNSTIIFPSQFMGTIQDIKNFMSQEYSK
ncbi:MAG: slipin family protein [Candidatus Magasanikbacteria bacterium]|nr:slipin family protein [Candidatus Magasanikbacteria bacterium]